MVLKLLNNAGVTDSLHTEMQTAITALHPAAASQPQLAFFTLDSTAYPAVWAKATLSITFTATPTAETVPIRFETTGTNPQVKIYNYITTAATSGQPTFVTLDWVATDLNVGDKIGVGIGASTADANVTIRIENFYVFGISASQPS